MNERNQIIERHLGVADSAARLFIKSGAARGIPPEDMIQESRLALVRAVEADVEVDPAKVFEICRDRARTVLRRAARDCRRLESVASMAA